MIPPATRIVIRFMVGKDEHVSAVVDELGRMWATIPAWPGERGWPEAWHARESWKDADPVCTFRIGPVFEITREEYMELSRYASGGA